MEDLLINFKDRILDPVILALVALYFSWTLFSIFRQSAREYNAVAAGYGREGVSKARLFWNIFLENLQGMLSMGSLAALVGILITQLEEIRDFVNGIWEDLKGTASLQRALFMYVPLLGAWVSLPGKTLQRIRSKIRNLLTRIHI